MCLGWIMSSKVVPFQQPASVDEQAAAWIVEIDQGGLDAGRLEELHAWIEAAPEHRRSLRDTAIVYGQADVMQVLAELTPLEQPIVVAQRARPAKVFRWSALGALAASLLIGVFYLVHPLSYPSQWFSDGGYTASLMTPVGGRQFIELPDGSTINLNTGSEIKVAYSSASRHISLERGEAYFNVARDQRRPFIVQVGEGQVTAVGTAFSVYRRSRDVEVAVTEGRVRIETGTPAKKEPEGAAGDPTEEAIVPRLPTEVVLEGGQLATFAESVAEIQEVAPEKLSRRLFWQQGMLAFEDDPLEVVVAEFSRYTGVSITIRDEALKSVRVDGYFKSDDLAGMLNSLRLNFGIEVVRHDKDTITLSRS